MTKTQTELLDEIRKRDKFYADWPAPILAETDRHTLLAIVDEQAAKVDNYKNTLRFHGIDFMDTPYGPAHTDKNLNLRCQIGDLTDECNALRKRVAELESESDTCPNCGYCAPLSPKGKRVLESERDELRAMLETLLDRSNLMYDRLRNPPKRGWISSGIIDRHLDAIQAAQKLLKDAP